MAARPSGIPTAAPTIVPAWFEESFEVVLFEEDVELSGVELIVAADEVLELGTCVALPEAELDVLLVPGSAKIVPNVGI